VRTRMFSDIWPVAKQLLY